MEKVVATHNMQSVDGSIYQVFEIQEYVDASNMKGSHWIEGMKRLELDDGSAVNFIDDDNFEIVMTGHRLKRS